VVAVVYSPTHGDHFGGVRMIFHNTPGAQAPAEMSTYFPDWKAVWVAENICATIHNIYQRPRQSQAAVGGAQPSRIRRAQQPRRDQPPSQLLGRQSRHPDSPITE